MSKTMPSETKNPNAPSSGSVDSSSTSALSADTIADIILYDYHNNTADNMNTVDGMFSLNKVQPETFDIFVNTYLLNKSPQKGARKNSNSTSSSCRPSHHHSPQPEDKEACLACDFNYKHIKIEYDDQLQLLAYSFPSFIHLISTPILYTIFSKSPLNFPSTSSSKQIHRSSSSTANNLILPYYHLNALLPILLKSKNKISSINKNLLIVPDGVILNPSCLTEPIFALEICSLRNLSKLHYKIHNIYPRFKRQNCYKTIMLLIVDEEYNFSIEIWKKIPLQPRTRDKKEEPFHFPTDEQILGYVNIPSSYDKNEHLNLMKQEIKNCINKNKMNAKSDTYNPLNKQYGYYLQSRDHINYNSCLLQDKLKELSDNHSMGGIMLHYLDVHGYPLPPANYEEHKHHYLINKDNVFTKDSTSSSANNKSNFLNSLKDEATSIESRFKEKLVNPKFIPNENHQNEILTKLEFEKEYSNSDIVISYDELRKLFGELINRKLTSLKNEDGIFCLEILEKIRNKAKKNYFDVCQHLDFPNL